MTETDQIYMREIQVMMHGCGDCARPLLATAKVIASLVQQQALNIAWRAEEQAVRRGTRSVSPRDIIFLMRKSPDKLRRLYQYLCVKEMKSNLTGASMVFESSADRNVDEVDGDVAGLLDSVKRTRQPNLLDMFTDFDVTGELLDAITSGTPDPIRQKREKRADSLAQNLDPSGYLEFAKARRAAFVNSRLSQQKFVEWVSQAMDTNPGLIGEPPVCFPRLTAPAVDILAYLAKETVAIVVDLAFLVRQDSCSTTPGGPLRPVTLRPPGAPTSSASSMVLDGSPLTPAEVREALRRYWSPFSESAGLVRSAPPQGCQLLAC